MRTKNAKGKPLFDALQFSARVVEAYTLDLRTEPFGFGEYHNYARENWLAHFQKKFLLPSDTRTREELCFTKFLFVNDDMATLNRSFDHLTCERDVQGMLIYAKSLIWHVLGPTLSYEEVFRGCKNSLGTSVGVPFWDTGPERKFRYPISLTRSCEPLWEEYLKWDQDLAHAIILLNEAGCEVTPPLKFVAGSRASTVPKTTDIDRMIAVEPVVNMFFQHGIAAVMEDRLASVGLSFDKDPEKHRRHAFEGSITNRLATIDFSSMSDRLSLRLCHFLLPREWFVWLCNVRSDVMILQGQSVRLHMISTMGNATTFPLETLVLWALARASTADLATSWVPRLPIMKNSQVSVFGDDCVLPSKSVKPFLKVCEAAGFKVNSSKTFYQEEHFRESCGGDFYHGRDVRPFFLGAFPEHENKVSMEAYLYGTLNTVIRKYISYFGSVSYLYNKALIGYLLSCLSSVTDQVKVVPEHFPEDSGLQILRDLRRWHRCYRYTSFAPVFVGRHGELSFSYLRFVYHESDTWNDRLRYAIKLKQLVAANDGCDRLVHLGPVDTRETPLKRTLRKRGKYVESKVKASDFSCSLMTPNTLIARV